MGMGDGGRGGHAHPARHTSRSWAGPCCSTPGSWTRFSWHSCGELNGDPRKTNLFPAPVIVILFRKKVSEDPIQGSQDEIILH